MPVIINALPVKNPNSKYRQYVCKLDDNSRAILSGVLPENLPNGLCFNAEYEITGKKSTQWVGNITSYSLNRTERTVNFLKKSGVTDIDGFFKACEIQNATKFRWDRCLDFSINMVYETMEFGEADKVHKAVVNNPEDIVRLKAINKLVLEKNRKKHKETMTVKEYSDMFKSIEETGCYSCLRCSSRIECLKDRRLLILNGRIIDKEIREARELVQSYLDRDIMPLMEEDEIEGCKEHYKGKLSDEQIACIDLLYDTRPCVITGGAGVGKTTVIEAIVRSYAKYYGMEHICLLAPTGKASRRIKEKTGFANCSTIHSQLRKADDFIFYNRYNKLPYNLIVVDESSMIDLFLMRDLLEAVDLQTKVVFVGDHNQLPPVDIGEPFFDFICDKKRVGIRYLTQNFRQGENNGILANANAILEGKEIKPYGNFIIRNIAYEDMNRYITQLPSTTVCISPYNELNAMINERVHNEKYNEYARECKKEGKTPRSNLPFNIGDRVIFLRNVKDMYCNGDTGEVVEYSGGSIMVKTDFGTKVEVKPKDISDITLAYALTIHKTQGSEYDDVKIFIPKDDRFVTSRMLYTAVTRAKRRIGLYFYDKPKEEKENKDVVW